MMESKPIIVNQKGMITIPSKLRKKFNIRGGTEVRVIEIDGNLTIIPIVDLENVNQVPLEKVLKIIDESHEEDIRNEE